MLDGYMLYEANIMIQVEDRAGSSRNNIEDWSNLFESKAGVASEIELLRSRRVLSHAVDSSRLYIKVQPKYFPGIGASNSAP